ncbi:MAG: hypothetical protein H0W96_03810 [Solirubrobacterales bacterium]|nr:hypothetical protein [Solirubrobacterales bacterium]
MPSTTGALQSEVFTFDDAVQTTTRVTRGGVVVDHTLATFDLQTGDVIDALNRATGALLASATFDGRPSLDPTTCIGSAAFAGLRTGNSNITDVVAFKRERITGRYGPQDRDSGFIRGEISTLSGPTFSGAFRKAIPAGYILGASQTVLLSDTATFYETVQRTVAACPPPPPPPVVPPRVVPPPPAAPPLVTLTGLRIKPSAFRAARSGTSVKPATGQLACDHPAADRLERA